MTTLRGFSRAADRQRSAAADGEQCAGGDRNLADDLGKSGVAVARESRLLPDFAASTRLYLRMLMSFLAVSFAPDVYAGARAAAKLPPTIPASPPSGCAASRSAIATG